MGKLWNRIRYGKSNTPRFISCENRWLYQGKWISDRLAYSLLSNKPVEYEYSLFEEDYGAFGYAGSFNEVVNLVSKYPFTIRFSDMTQFSTQEINMILGIQRAAVEKRKEEVNQNIQELRDALRNFGEF